MSDSSVLDASALLALLDRERGWEQVEDAMPGALIGIVNLAEVVSKLAERGMPAERALAAALALRPRVVDLGLDQVEDIARLRPLTRHARLSLGDRCCLSLARLRGGTVLTAERAWAALAPSLGVTVRNTRPPVAG